MGKARNKRFTVLTRVYPWLEEVFLETKMDKTPEEKLLDLIRQKQRSPGRWINVFEKARAFVSGVFKDRIKSFKTMSPFRAGTRVLLGGVVLLVAFMAWQWHAQKASRAQWEKDLTAMGERVEAAGDEEESASSGVKVNLRDLTRRNLFVPLIKTPKPKPKPVVAAPPPPPPAPKIPLSRRAANLTLVGILEGDPREAVIEDAKKRSSIYVKPGDKIGEIQVKDVLPDKVILFFEEETLDLRL